MGLKHNECNALAETYLPGCNNLLTMAQSSTLVTVSGSDKGASGTACLKQSKMSEENCNPNSQQIGTMY